MKNTWLFLLILLGMFGEAQALESAEVAVVANRFVEESVELARYYMEKRGIPQENLIRIDTTDKERCSRKDYDREIAEPVRKFLQGEGRGDIRCLVTMFGVPLKVGAPEMTGSEKKQYRSLIQDKRELQQAIKSADDPGSPHAGQLKDRLAAVNDQLKFLDKYDQTAAVDSELALVLSNSYSLPGMIPNPFFLGNQQKSLPMDKDNVLLVSRLDGPTVEIVKRLIDDSLFAEENGLKGKAYFDAKNKRAEKKILKPGYAFYDHSLHLAGDRVKQRNLMPVVVDEKRELFQSGDAPDAALYCGWYSYAKYVDAFDWAKGSVGYHIASAECATLRPGKSQVWCKRMLEDGAAAVIGPVAEPYVQAFPVPEIFFHYLTDGYYSLAEAYFLSMPYLSWQMVLVGDPLYRPFKNYRAAGG